VLTLSSCLSSHRSAHLSVILERKKKIYSTHFLAEVGTISIIAIMVTLYHCGEMLLLLLVIVQAVGSRYHILQLSL
jgi:hypothetical protein